MIARTYRAGFFFCGLGAGARGIAEARVSLLGHSAQFESVGGIDLDPLACADFEALTNSPALCADMREVTPGMLRDLMGETAPDLVFGSPPCQSFSRLLSPKRTKERKYQQLNGLVLVWLELVLATWATPPRLLLLENVEGIEHRGQALLAKVRTLLRRAGYVLEASVHDCGEIGGLAQHRRRYLLVARHQATVANFLYQPPKRRVRGCGEVIGPLPIPGDVAGGPLHKLPRLTAKNWLRLALIPAGGDWRDIEGAAAQGLSSAFRQGYGVLNWAAPAGTIKGGSRIGQGAFSVADPRVSRAYDRGYGVLAFDQPSPTVAGGSAVGQGAYAVADPRAVSPTSHPIDWTSTRPLDDPPILIANDGTWHRPLTILELAALQGLPTALNGEPLTLAGSSSGAWRTRIGNAVPVGAAKAIGERMLSTLLGSDLSAFSLSSDRVWVDAPDSDTPGVLSQH